MADAVVPRIGDPVLPENTGTYRVDAGGAAGVDDAAAPDLCLGVAEAGASYLGGTTFGESAAAGRITEERAFARRPPTAFACRAPTVVWTFC